MVDALHLVLLLWIASFSLFESSAILIDLSCFTVITTGRMKYSSEHLCNFIIFFIFYQFM